MKFYQGYQSDDAVRQLDTQPAYKVEFEYETKLWKYPIGVEPRNIHPGG